MTVYPCRAVLFDCDGVLVDSDESVIDAWTRWALAFDLNVGDVIDVVHGRRAADTVAALISETHRDEALAKINEFELELAQKVTAIPGAVELTSAIPRTQWAVVTSGTTVLARARLRAAGFADPVVLITADDVERGKPDPAGYLAAASRVGVAPGDAVVLEDAAAGIAAARAAGVSRVIGVGGRGLLDVADVLVNDLTAVSWAKEALQIETPG